ncbi:MAG: host specificity factor TipJ family phage tail protein, partial [Nitrospira sp.]|nr:host specificity factor TipJ family phage tail protein [Nitrospira sp.]
SKNPLTNGSEMLNILVGVAEGEIESIDQIEINNNPIENYYSVWTQQTKGTSSQGVLPHFADVVTSYDQQAKVTTTGYTYTSRAKGMQAAIVHIHFPQGLYAIEDRLDKQRRIQDLGNENLAISDQINHLSGLIVDNQQEINYLMNAQPDGYANTVWQLSWANSNMQEEISILQSQSSANSQRQVSISGTMIKEAQISTTVVFEIQYRLHGSQSAWRSAGRYSVVDRTSSAIRRSYRIDNLAPGKYDIKIFRLTPDPQSFMTIDDLYLSAVDEILLDDLAYPHTALLAVRALATDQLSGGMPNITSVVKGRKIKTWDVATGAWVTKWSANPVWIIRDLLTNDRYGIGAWVDNSQIDLDSFKTAAAYCDEMVDDGAGGEEVRYRWDGVIDGCPQPWELLQQICSTFDAVLLWSGGKFRLLIDRPATASQSFGMGDIIADSATFSYTSADKRINTIEIQYSDEDENWRMQMIPFMDRATYEQNLPPRKRAVSLIGVTRRSQALRMGNIQMNRAQLLRRSVEFTVGSSGLAAEVYDVINLTHDVPQWGYSGTLLRSTGRRLHLDSPVYLADGVTYKIRIIKPDGTEEENTVASAPGYYKDWITVVNDWQGAILHSSWQLGPIGPVFKQFRITEISRAGSDHLRKITAIEYNPDVWSGVFDPSGEYSPPTLLHNPLALPPQVTDLKLSEKLYFNRGGVLVVG